MVQLLFNVYTIIIAPAWRGFLSSDNCCGLTILFHLYYVNNQMIAYFDGKISPILTIIAARVKSVSYNEKYRVN